MNALLRAPFEEGPLYLFKGGLPIAVSAWSFWVTYAMVYSFNKNKYYFLWIYNDFSYDYIKAGNMAISFICASALSYPFYFAREMVDLWPKERGGFCTWNNNYKDCMKWMIQYYDMLYFNFFANYTTWFRRQGAGWLIGLWLADSYGMFSNCNEAHNSLEVQFPISSEAI